MAPQRRYLKDHHPPRSTGDSFAVAATRHRARCREPGTTKHSTGNYAVQLRISIDKGEPYNHFRAELRTTAGKVIASQSNLTAPPPAPGERSSGSFPRPTSTQGI